MLRQVAVLVTVVVMVAVVDAGYRTCPHPLFWRHKQGMCGSQLTQAISVVCDKKYYSGKRSEPNAMPSTNLIDDEQLLSWPLIQELSADMDESENFIPKIQATTYLHRGRRRTSGLACECCYYQCRYREMKQYCSI